MKLSGLIGGLRHAGRVEYTFIYGGRQLSRCVFGFITLHEAVEAGKRVIHVEGEYGIGMGIWMCVITWVVSLVEWS